MNRHEQGLEFYIKCYSYPRGLLFFFFFLLSHLVPPPASRGFVTWIRESDDINKVPENIELGGAQNFQALAFRSIVCLKRTSKG